MGNFARRGVALGGSLFNRCKSAFLAVAVAALVIGGQVAPASAQTGPVWPTGVPQVVDPTVVLDTAVDVLTFIMMPIIFTSLAILAAYMIWRLAKRFVSGGA